MVLKRLLCPQRVRKPPAGFNWLDHRLVRDRYIDRCSHQAAALYLFLVTVADVRGLSYYSDASVMERLHMDNYALDQARRNLIKVGLIAWRKPLYQALDLNPDLTSAYQTATVVKPSYPSDRRSPCRRPQSVKEILKTIMEDKI